MAAGRGTRMRPLTDKIAKPLIEINGKPFLEYLINNLKKAGYTEFCFIVGYKKEQIINYVNSLNINATFIEQTEQKGTGHALMHAKDFVKNENFVVLPCDNLFSAEDLGEMNKHDSVNYAKVIEVENPSLYGVIIEENGYLREIKEKPKKFVGNLINTGLFKFNPEIFDALNKIELSPRGELELTDALTLLGKQRKVKILKVKNYWKDLGCMEDIPKLEKFLSSSELF